MRLPADIAAPPPDRQRRGRLVLVHGFTQTRLSWSTIARQLTHEGFEVVTTDAPGHGEAADLRVDLPGGAVMLGDTGGWATYVGYSMGGRLALHLAVARPDLVERLVLVSSTAGIDNGVERAIRQVEDENRATEIERSGVAAFLDKWLASPLFANLPPDAAQLSRPSREHRRRVGVEPAPRRHRCPGLAVATPAFALDACARRRWRARREVHSDRRADGGADPRRHAGGRRRGRPRRPPRAI